MNQTTIKKIQKQLINLLPVGKKNRLDILFTDCCSELSRLVANWIKSFNKSDNIFILKGINVCSTRKMHDILAVSSKQNKVYIIDPTIWQFFPKAKSILVFTSDDINIAFKKIQTIYGGQWSKKEKFVRLDKKEEKKYLDIIHQNIQENLEQLNRHSNMTIEQLQKRTRELRDQKKHTEGIILIEKWLKTNTEDPAALSILGELLDKRALTRTTDKLKRNDNNQARAIYKSLIKKYPDCNYGYFGLVRLYSRSKNKKAFDIAREYIKISKNNAYYMYLGHCYLDYNDLDNAEKCYLKAYPHIKNHYGPDYALAKLYLRKNDLKKAKKYANQSIAKFEKMEKKYHEMKIVRDYIEEMKNITCL